jgi:hypothetical protein
MSEKLSAVKRLVEAEIEKAKKFVGAAMSDAHSSTAKPVHACDDHACSCRIPTPCWLPEDLGDLVVTIEREGTARLTVRVRNKDGQPRQVTAQVTGTGSQFVAPASGGVAIPAFGYGSFTFTVTVPAQAPVGTYVDVQIAINGCRRHVLNWRIDALEKCDRDAKSTQELVVCDGAELIHRWYDHFYCERPCPPVP